jgi:hypothetical protein
MPKFKPSEVPPRQRKQDDHLVKRFETAPLFFSPYRPSPQITTIQSALLCFTVREQGARQKVSGG